MRTSLPLIASLVLSFLATACAPHHAGTSVQAPVDQTERSDQPGEKPDHADKSERRPGPGEVATSAKSYADLLEAFNAYRSELHQLNFYSMDDVYSIRSIRSVLHGTAVQDRPRIKEILGEIKSLVDQMQASPEVAADPKARAYADYVRLNVERCLKKMEILAQMSSLPNRG